MDYIALNVPCTDEELAGILTAELADFPFESFETGDGVLKAIPPTDQAMFLAAHRVGSYLETDGTNPTAWGGTWQQEPSLGPYKWKRTK